MNKDNTAKYKSGSIYKFTCIINNKSYIGQSLHPKNRIKGHIKDALKGNTKYLLYEDIRKYGIDNFNVSIIDTITVKRLDYVHTINEREKYYINLYNSITPNGYNKNSGGSGATIVSEYTRNKLSTTMNSPEYKQHMSNIMKEIIPKGKDSPYYGKKRPIEDCIRMMEGKLNIKLSKEKYLEIKRLKDTYGTYDHNKIRDKIKKCLYKERLKEQQLQIKNDKLLLKEYQYKQNYMKYFLFVTDKDIRKSFVNLIQRTAWKNCDTYGSNYKRLKYIKDSNISLYDSDWYEEFKEQYLKTPQLIINYFIPIKHKYNYYKNV